MELIKLHHKAIAILELIEYAKQTIENRSECIDSSLCHFPKLQDKAKAENRTTKRAIQRLYRSYGIILTKIKTNE